MSTTEQSVTLVDVKATEQIGARLAQKLTSMYPPFMVYLTGDLGAGKTTLVRGFLQALGFKQTVKSPSYTLVETYDLDDKFIVHCDLYRLTDSEELTFMGFSDYLTKPAIVFIEWPEHGDGCLPKPDLEIRMEESGSGKQLYLTCVSKRAQSLTDQWL